MKAGALVDYETGEIIAPAEEINQEHALARQSAESAVEHAVRCGELLIEQKAQLAHGEFRRWVTDNCEFSVHSAKKYMQAARQKDNALSFSSLRQALGYDSKATAHVSQNTGENEWYTPDDYLGAARAVMGGIDLDPASSEMAQSRVQANTYYSKDDDGLQKTWSGAVWMNPPYAQPLVARFCEKLLAELPRITHACVLINNATETRWLQPLLREADAVCFPVGRVRFLDPDGNPGAPLQGQAVVYFGPNGDAFHDHFSRFGVVLMKYVPDFDG